MRKEAGFVESSSSIEMSGEGCMRGGFFRASCLAAACAALASCGGGGGGASDGGGDAATSSLDATVSSRITFTPSSIQVVQTQGYPESVTERVTIGPEPSGSQFYAVIAADKPVVQTGQVFLTENSDGSATATMHIEPALAPGTYDGQLTLHICRDLQCKDEVSLTGNDLPYSIKVVPRAELQVTGVAASNWLGNPGSYLVDPGATVVITSNTPVTWSAGSSISGASLDVISSTPTRWEGRILGRSGLFIGVVGSSVDKPGNNSVSALFNIR